MKNVIALLSFSILMGTSAVASPQGGSFSGINATATNQATNNQSAIGTVNQSPIGGINSNYQINNSQSTDYGFAPGIYCRGTNLSFGAYGSGFNSGSYGTNSSASDYGAIAMLTIPIGGDVMSSCKALAKEIVKQRQLDTLYNMIKVCSSMKKENIKVNYETFPEFKVCDDVFVSNNSRVPQVNTNPFAPKDNTTITVPVK